MHTGDDVTCVRDLPQEPAEVPRGECLEDPLGPQGPPRPPGVCAPDVHRSKDTPDRGAGQEVHQVLHHVDHDVVDVEDPGGDGARVHTGEDNLLLSLVGSKVSVLRCVLGLGHNIIAVKGNMRHETMRCGSDIRHTTLCLVTDTDGWLDNSEAFAKFHRCQAPASEVLTSTSLQ